MGKRKISNKKKKEGSKTIKSVSFWTNAGQNPMPAVNVDRPFDFDMGLDNNLEGFTPYEMGNAQYVVTDIAIPRDWPNSAAFDLAATKLYQSIRENLRSNLAYDEHKLKAYLASVTWLQVLFSAINRDFAFLKYRDAQHPSFERIWGRYCNNTDDVLSIPGNAVTIADTYVKEYLGDDIATSLTFIDNVLVPKAKLLLLPPAASEWAKWLFESVFVDEMNPSRAQFYWNEIASIPIYSYIPATSESEAYIEYSGDLSTYNSSLQDIVDYVSYIATTYGVIIADLRRCGAEMVCPDIKTSSERQATMRYDQVYFSALRNAYTGSWPNEDNPEFFLVDFYEGMSSSQMCSALMFAGALVNNNELVKPIIVRNQYALVYLDHEERLYPDPYRSDSDEVYFASNWGPGVVALMISTTTTTQTKAVPTGSVIPDRDINIGDSVYIEGYCGNEYKTRAAWKLEWNNATHIFIPIFSISDGLSSGAIMIDKPDWNIEVDTDDVLVASYTGGFRTVRKTAPSKEVLFDWGSSLAVDNGDFTGVVRITAVRSFGGKWNILMQANVSTNVAGTAAQDLFQVAGYSSTVIGTSLSSDNFVVDSDPSKSLLDWLTQEVDHHIPIRLQPKCVRTDDTEVFSSKVLLKETNVSTMYSRTELSALQYSLMLSLYYVHATMKQRSFEKKA